MKLRWLNSPAQRAHLRSAQWAFTVTELLVASAISVLIMTSLGGFTYFAARSISGVVTQTEINEDAWKAAQLMADRIRVATSVSNDASGNCLTLGFDDNIATDSDGDGKAYNDKTHYEAFEFRNGDGNDLTTTNNSLVYRANAGSLSNPRVLVRSGVRKLPNQRIFTLTNLNTVQINYGLVDAYARDFRQSMELQLIAVPRNRPSSTNVIQILP